ncbi:MAG: hypothetical protein ACLT76_06470 [Clostridium fessum]
MIHIFGGFFAGKSPAPLQFDEENAHVGIRRQGCAGGYLGVWTKDEDIRKPKSQYGN